jgi:putative GTP pyrophosphokinase
MAKTFSKTQIDRLGDRLKKGEISDADLRLLDEYRRSFADAFEIVIGKIRNELSLELTERVEKSTPSIVEKLKRESIRLSQIQDIAGCRLIVPDVVTQERVVQSLEKHFERTAIIDRRQKPSHGYRAVHVIVGCLDKAIEVQVRTSLQHLWAEISEKFSDVIDSSIKYGGGNEDVRKYLTESYLYIAQAEKVEMLLEDLQMLDEEIQTMEQTMAGLPEELKILLNKAERLSPINMRSFNAFKQELIERIRKDIMAVEKLKG